VLELPSAGALECKRDRSRLQRHPRSGWPFWWRWVVATNLGWFPGIFLGLQVAPLIPGASSILQACVAALIAGACFGAAQAFSLRAYLEHPFAWWWTTGLGWSGGVGIARALLDSMPGSLPGPADVAVVAFIAGGLVGLPQAWLLSSRSSRWPWWPVISALGWGALFPGALPGAGLVWLARAERIDFAG
jgi:hypothetical protein